MRKIQICMCLQTNFSNTFQQHKTAWNVCAEGLKMNALQPPLGKSFLLRYNWSIWKYNMHLEHGLFAFHSYTLSHSDSRPEYSTNYISKRKKKCNETWNLTCILNVLVLFAYLITSCFCPLLTITMLLSFYKSSLSKKNCHHRTLKDN